MQISKVLKLTALCAALGASAVASAAPTYSQNVTSNVIMGSGIANGGFTLDTANGIEIGLRARERYDLVTNLPTNVTGDNGDGTYNQNAGEPSGFPTSNRARWNFDWSINTGTTGAVGAYTYLLGIDFDAGLGTNFQTFDPITLACADHSFGNSGTAQSAGTEVAGAAASSACAGAFAAADVAQYASLKSSNSLVQNSWNMDFFDSVAFPFDPNANGQYTIFLSALGANGQELARSTIEVIVGTGATVPEPTSLALIGLALVGLAATRRRA